MSEPETAPALAHRGPDDPLPKGADRRYAVEEVSLPRAAARDRLPGRRIRLGQVGDRACRDGAPAQGAADAGRGPRAARGRGPARRQRAAAARAALHPDVDDLPGADDRAQPGDALRRPDRRGAEHAHPARRRGPARAHPQDHERGPPARARADRRRLSAPALGRPAPAHHDRDGARARAGAADRRRADDRARRHHPGADPAADQGPAARPRHRRAVHHPRLRRGRRDRRPRRGDAVGPRGRARRDPPGALEAAPRLHPHADLRGAEPGAAPARARRRGRGRAAHRGADQGLRRRLAAPRPRGARGRGGLARGAARRDARHRRRVRARASRPSHAASRG